ncbi:MAG: alcohol dehydrogenase, partial [Porticoccaceae bacterium]|nr:alcohol dehydrogenase [Porticoccaceae bacterium]
MSVQIILPRILQVGAGASQEAGAIVQALECQRPLIVTDKMM